MLIPNVRGQALRLQDLGCCLPGAVETSHVWIGERHGLSDLNQEVHVLSLYLEKMVIQGYRSE